MRAALWPRLLGENDFALVSRPCCRCWQALDKPAVDATRFRVLFSSEVRCRGRLYAGCGGNPQVVALDKSLAECLAMSQLYVMGSRLFPCLDALSRIDELQRAPRISDAIALDLFPSCEALQAVATLLAVNA